MIKNIDIENNVYEFISLPNFIDKQGRKWSKKKIKECLVPLQEKIKNCTLFGELCSVDDYNLKLGSISLHNASHYLTDLKYVGSGNDKGIHIKLKLVNQIVSGRTVEELFKENYPIDINIRTAARVNNKKEIECKKIFTFDLIVESKDLENERNIWD